MHARIIRNRPDSEYIFAANAEESASTAEELNAQAVNLKEAVSDLLVLVDGSATHLIHPSPTRPSPHAQKPKSEKSSFKFSRTPMKMEHE